MLDCPSLPHYRQLTVSLSAVEQNLAALHSRLPSGTRLMPMIKANGYGTGALELAQCLAELGVDLMGVAFVQEALTLRAQGFQGDLFVCQPNGDEFPYALDAGLQLAMMSIKQVDELEQLCSEKGVRATVHLKVNTGLNRFGCAPDTALCIARAIAQSPHLQLDGIMTHFACADDPAEDAFTLAQVACFDQVIAEIEAHGIPLPWRHAANSAGIQRFELPQYNMARPGISLMGVPPSASDLPQTPLRLAPRLESAIVHINQCEPGDSISYARSYTCRRPCERIAAIPIGYADGIQWGFRNKGSFLVRGKEAPLVGNICMDTTLIDITHIPEAELGDPVLLFGSEHPPTLLAEQWGTIPYQLLVALGPRITRKFVR